MRPPPPPATPTVSLPSVPRRLRGVRARPAWKSDKLVFRGAEPKKDSHRPLAFPHLPHLSPPPSLPPSSCRIGIDAIRPRPRIRCGGLQLGGWRLRSAAGTAARLISCRLLIPRARSPHFVSGPGSTAGKCCCACWHW
ncbi:hypothetical protein PVAP13_9KG190085 [Panicum virgatum]|uniref:Uncharacterized protein n=1 Tax=Panicum virgatum TaxID=38727 RepID=A0A8T0NMW1_PANVG|nr:hypothetical protein PVAP13_9KG190085 [Panicum virgatum]